MDLLVLARCLRDEAAKWAKQQSGVDRDLQDIALTGAARANVEAFAVAFRFEILDPRVGSTEYTVTISETKKR